MPLKPFVYSMCFLCLRRWNACVAVRIPMTGKLNVTFRKPTPLERELSLSGALVGVEGRKIRTEARIHDGDELLAEAEGLFIAVRMVSDDDA